MPNKTILITGGAGFIGSNLADSLWKENKVIVLDNLSTGSLENLKGMEVDFREGDCQEVNKLVPEKVDTIFHIGIVSSTPLYRNNRALVAKEIGGAIAVFEKAVQDKAKVVIASSSSLYNQGTIPYKESQEILITDFYPECRIAIERLAQLYSDFYGIRAVVLRMFSVYGGKREEAKGKYANVVLQFIWLLKKGESPVFYGDGGQTRDFIYIDDVVRAFLLAAEYDISFDIFNIGRGENYSFNQVLELLNQKLGTNIKAKYVENPLKNYVYHTLADTANAEERLNFKAKYSLKEGIEKIIRELN